MLSVVIPTLNAAATLGETLAALVPAAISGLVREVVVADAGSSDATLAIADATGARIVEGQAGAGAQLAAGCSAARGDWLMILRADTVLQTGWEAAVTAHLQRAPDKAGYFRWAQDDPGLVARLREWGVALGGGLLGLPGVDQGLLISKRLYETVGGYRPAASRADIDLVRRLGRARLARLAARAVSVQAGSGAEGAP